MIQRGEASVTDESMERTPMVRHLRRERTRQSLLAQELYLDTEIMQREPSEPVYEDSRLKERDTLRDRLRRIEHERRRLALLENETLRGLHDRLLEVLNQQRQLRSFEKVLDRRTNRG